MNTSAEDPASFAAEDPASFVQDAPVAPVQNASSPAVKNAPAAADAQYADPGLVIIPVTIGPVVQNAPAVEVVDPNEPFVGVPIPSVVGLDENGQKVLRCSDEDRDCRRSVKLKYVGVKS